MPTKTHFIYLSNHPQRIIIANIPRATQPSIPPGYGKSSTGLYGWGQGGVCLLVSCVSWQVTPRSAEMECKYISK